MTTKQDYDRAFEKERSQVYPDINATEAVYGFSVDRDRLENAARVLACPVKKNPPCWQHGRVIYSVLRRYIKDNQPREVVGLDIGTAKGFSALCAVWAAQDAGVPVLVHSVDVIDPAARVSRNTVAEVDGLKTLYEIVAPWSESRAIRFQHARADTWLALRRERLNFAFVDGKHTYDAVSAELGYLKLLQQPGDVVICDDVHLAGVRSAVDRFASSYSIKTVHPLVNRAYAILEKKGCG